MTLLESLQKQTVTTNLTSYDPGIQYEPFLFAPREPTPAAAPARADQGHGLSQAVAAPDTGNGCWPRRSRLDTERGAPISRAAVAAASGGMRKRAQERERRVAVS